MHEQDLAFTQLRQEALALPEPCAYCHAETGKLCVNKKNGYPLEHVAAHYARLKLIGLDKAKVTR
jgi:hypothetical protein